MHNNFRIILLHCLFLVVATFAFAKRTVILESDSLYFKNGERTTDIWSMYEKITNLANGKLITTKRVKVAPDNRYFLLHEQEYFTAKDSFYTKATFFTANKKKIWERHSTQFRKILFELCAVFNERVVLVMTDKFNLFPSMELIEKNKSDTIVVQEEWRRIMKYAFSPNGRYIVMHAKDNYVDKVWDFIYFIDIKTGNNWTYRFPICVSCKKYNIDISVSDDGVSDVVYKFEHRIFDKEGRLIDVYLGLGETGK